MKWIEIALKYCTLTLMSSLEQKKAMFNVKYEIVLRTPYSKARWGGWSKGICAIPIWNQHILNRGFRKADLL